MQKGFAASKLINGRYKLNKCVFASDLGSLYLSSDKHQRTPEPLSSDTRVLIHFFPSHSINVTELPKLFSTLQRNKTRLPCEFLPVVDYGYLDKAAYFVMAVPDSWSVNALPTLDGTPSTLHQQAMKSTQDLLQNEFITQGLVPQAFIVIPGGVYLLQTALLKQFQQLQQQAFLLPVQNTTTKHPAGKPEKRVAVFGWASMIGVVIAGSGYAYYLSQQTGTSGAETAVFEVFAQNEPQEITEVVPDKVEIPEVPVISRQSEKADANKADTVVAINSEDESQFSPRIMENDLRSDKQPTDVDIPQQTVPTAPEAFPIEQEQQETAVEAETVNEKPEVVEVAEVVVSPNVASPNIAPAEAKPVVPEPQAQQHPIISHDEATPAEPVAIDPAPVPPLPEELAVLKNLPVNTVTLTPVKTSADVAPAEVEPRQEKKVSSVPEPRESNHPIMIATSPAGLQGSITSANESAKPEKSTASASATQAAKAAANQGKESPEPTAGGMTKVQLIEKAYQAIGEDKLSEAADNGAIYYIRLLKRIDRTNPQINRLARQVVLAYHGKAREAIRQKHQRVARQLLWMAGRIIKEFNLLKMNEAHQILTHRMGK